MLGRIEPRIFTPPLRELTPDTSAGFDQVAFARDVLRRPFDPWQEWTVIHAGELLPDGRPRFRIVLVLVSRQNGKTEIPAILSAHWMFVDAFPLVMGTSTKIDYARESWHKAIQYVERSGSEEIDALRPSPRWKREANGEQESWTSEGARYKIAASNAEGGRSLTINRLIADELRQHHDYSAWAAMEPACSPMDAQIWALSNMGDHRSVVLNDLRAEALAFIETGEGDPRLGLFEWSSPPDSDPADLEALAQANPSLGRRLDPDVLLAEARRAVRLGGEALAAFKTERMCLRVPMLDPAVDPEGWRAGAVPGDLSGCRSRLACVLDGSPDSQHWTLVAAGVLPDGRVRVEPVAAWSGPGAALAARRELRPLLARVRPQVFGWFPNGPAAELAADLADRGERDWPPKGVTVTEIKAETPAVCMGFAGLVRSVEVLHADDPLLNDHVPGAGKLAVGNRWVFSRKGEGHVDAAYAAAGAVHLARTLPPPIGKPRLITAP